MAGGYINKSGNYELPELGIVHINVRANARNVRARWKGGMIYLMVPKGIPYDQLCQLVKGMTPQLDNMRPSSMYYLGQKIEMPEFSVEIGSQNYAPHKMLLQGQDNRYIIMVGSGWDMESHDTIVTISKLLCRIAQTVAPRSIIPFAKTVSQRVGKAPLLWTISNGHRVLGHCNSQGTIALSHVLVFYPLHLREYVICHELAHLSEMNHSPRFHEICNEYCNGQEADLMAQLRAYKIPVIK